MRAVSRALTIWPEWVFAMRYLGKDIENRTWTQASAVGERIALHAGMYPGGLPGKRAARRGLRVLGAMALRNRWSWMLDEDVRFMLFHGSGSKIDMGSVEMKIDSDHDTGIPLVTGAIVGTAVVDSISSPQDGDLNCCTFRSWGAVGMYHWHLTDFEFFRDPIPARGKQKIWKLDPEQKERVLSERISLQDL